MQFLIMAACWAVAWVTTAWVTMVTVGNIHAWWSFCPTMGFGDALSIAAVPVGVSFIAHLILSAFSD